MLQVSGILGGILDYVAKDKSLKRQYGSQLCSTILSQWTSMSSWWTGGNNEYQLAAVSLLKRLLILEPKVCKPSSNVQMREPSTLFSNVHASWNVTVHTHTHTHTHAHTLGTLAG